MPFGPCCEGGVVWGGVGGAGGGAWWGAGPAAPWWLHWSVEMGVQLLVLENVGLISKLSTQPIDHTVVRRCRVRKFTMGEELKPHLRPNIL